MGFYFDAKWLLFVAIGVAILVVVGLFILKGRQGPNPPTEEKSSKSVSEAFIGLRKIGLEATPAEVGIDPSALDSGVWAVVMDWEISGNIATLVAIADGTASLYLSSGGGIIGAGQKHESVRRSAKALVSTAAKSANLLTPTATFPLPKAGKVRFYVRTLANTLTAEVNTEELGKNQHVLSPLFHAAQSLITELRTTEK